MLIFTMPPPALAVDREGRLFAAWHDARNGDWDVFVRRSTDGGRRWSEARRLNDDPVGNGRHQYQPRLGVAPGGRLDAVFYDRRSDADNVRNDVRYTFSTDGARTFAPNVALTAAPSSTKIGPRYLVLSARGRVEYGARLALLSRRDHAVAAWTDTRNSLPGAQQDVFATEVTLGARRRPLPPPPTEGSPPWPVFGGAGLAAAVALVALASRRRRGPPVGGEHTAPEGAAAE